MMATIHSVSQARYAVGFRHGLVYVVLLFIVAACASPLTPEPPGGKAEVPISAVTISQIEITQGLATGGPFVPGRSTAVIAHLTSSGGAVTVTGTLSISVTGTLKPKITAVRPVALAAGASAAPSKEELVFEPIVLDQSSDVDFQVDVVVASLTPGQVLASQSLNNQIFMQTTTIPYLYYTRIDFKPSSQGLPPDSLIGPKAGDAFARGVLPLPETSWFYASTPIPEIVINADECAVCPSGVSCPTPLPCSDPADPSDMKLNIRESPFVFWRISLIREQINHGGMLGPTELDVVQGWVYDPLGNGVVESNGAATGADRRLAYGTTSPARGQKTYTHELLHLVRQCFLASCAGLNDQPSAPLVTTRLGWDVGGHLLTSGWWSSSTVPPQRKQSFSPIMDLQDTANSWISPDEYNSAIGYFGSPVVALIAKLIEGCTKQPDSCEKQLQYYECPEPPLNGSAPTVPSCFAKGMIVFRGALEGHPQTASNAEIVTLTAVFPATRISRYSQASYTYSTAGKEGLPFVLRLWRDKERYVDFPFDARVTVFPTDRSVDTRFGYFEVTVPFDIAVRSIRADILYYKTKQSLPYLNEQSYLSMINRVR